MNENTELVNPIFSGDIGLTLNGPDSDEYIAQAINELMVLNQKADIDPRILSGQYKKIDKDSYGNEIKYRDIHSVWNRSRRRASQFSIRRSGDVNECPKCKNDIK